MGTFLNFFFDYGVELIPRKGFLGIFYHIPYIFGMKLIPGEEIKYSKKESGFMIWPLMLFQEILP